MGFGCREVRHLRLAPVRAASLLPGRTVRLLGVRTTASQSGHACPDSFGPSLDPLLHGGGRALRQRHGHRTAVRVRRAEIQEGGHYAVADGWQGFPAAMRPAYEYIVVDTVRSPSAPMSVRARRCNPDGSLDEPVWIDLRAIVASWDVWERQKRQQAEESARLRQEIVTGRQALIDTLQACGVPESRLGDFAQGMSEYVVLTEPELWDLVSRVGSTR